MGMFDGFEDLTTKVPSNTNCFPATNLGEHEEDCPAQKPVETPTLKAYKPNIPFEDYNAHGELVGYWWYEGDQVELRFNISGEVVIEGDNTYLTLDEWFKEKKMTFRLFNFRREEIAVAHYDASTTISFMIDETLSKELKKGTYYCSLELWDGNHILNRTVYRQDDCTLTIR